VITAMAELGGRHRRRRPQRLTHELAQRADLVVTMGCGDTCPYIPGKHYLVWDLPDPRGRPVDEAPRHARRHRTMRRHRTARCARSGL